MSYKKCLKHEKTPFVFSNLHDMKQADIRELCLKLWKVPDHVRAAPQKEEPAVKFMRLLKVKDIDLFSMILRLEIILS